MRVAILHPGEMGATVGAAAAAGGARLRGSRRPAGGARRVPGGLVRLSASWGAGTRRGGRGIGLRRPLYRRQRCRARDRSCDLRPGRCGRRHLRRRRHHRTAGGSGRHHALLPVGRGRRVRRGALRRLAARAHRVRRAAGRRLGREDVLRRLYQGRLHFSWMGPTFAAAGLPDGFHRAAGELYDRLAEFKDVPGPVGLPAVIDALTRARVDKAT